MKLNIAGFLIIVKLVLYPDRTLDTYVDTVYVAEACRDREVRTNLRKPVLDFEDVFRLGIERVVINRF